MPAANRNTFLYLCGEPAIFMFERFFSHAAHSSKMKGRGRGQYCIIDVKMYENSDTIVFFKLLLGSSDILVDCGFRLKIECIYLRRQYV
jgi:hypothetical protein